MKKEDSGKIVFLGYAVLFLVMVVLGWNRGSSMLFLGSAIGLVIALVSGLLQFIRSEQKVLTGYGLVGSMSLLMAVFAIFRSIPPADRWCFLIIFAASGFVFYHCFKTLLSRS